MAETPYLVDSNVLLRWLKTDHSDYPAIVSATDAILPHDGVLCYTSQNVGEFWNACTRPVDRNGYGLSPQETDRLAKFFEEKLRLLPDSLAVHEEWRKLLVTHSVSVGLQGHSRIQTKKSGTIGREKVAQILQLLDRVEFMKLEGRAFTWAFDTPTIGVRTLVDGRTKQVTSDADFVGAPKGRQARFVEAASEIDAILASSTWFKCEGECGSSVSSP